MDIFRSENTYLSPVARGWFWMRTGDQDAASDMERTDMVEEETGFPNNYVEWKRHPDEAKVTVVRVLMEHFTDWEIDRRHMVSVSIKE